MVMGFHLATTSWADRNSIALKIVDGGAAYPELFSATWFGWVGVEIFFVISGLVIVYSADGMTALGFLQKRALRLYPAAWICATISAVIVLALGLETHQRLLREFLASITLFPFGPWVDVVYWTLGVEISFYALVFLILALDQFHHLERVVLALGLLSSAYWIAGNAFAPEVILRHMWGRTADLSLVAYGCFFSIGAMTYVVFRQGRSLGRVLAMALCMVAGLIEIKYKTVNANSVFHGVQADQLALVPQMVFGVATLLILVSMRGVASVGNRAAYLIRMIGLATYPLYLFHQIVGAAIMKLVLAHGGSKYTALGLAICLCVAGSIAIASVIEPPVRALLRRYLAWIAGWRLSKQAP